MIEFHEDEYFYSPLEEDTLRILLNFLPREAYDQLLYRGNVSVRHYHRFAKHIVAPRIQRDRFRNCRFRIVEAKKDKKETVVLYPLASGG